MKVFDWQPMSSTTASTRSRRAEALSAFGEVLAEVQAL
jgi:hypothetical protein